MGLKFGKEILWGSIFDISMPLNGSEKGNKRRRVHHTSGAV